MKDKHKENHTKSIIIKVLKSYKKLASPQSYRLIANCIPDTSTGMTSRILRLNSSKANS